MFLLSGRPLTSRAGCDMKSGGPRGAAPRGMVLLAWAFSSDDIEQRHDDSHLGDVEALNATWGVRWTVPTEVGNSTNTEGGSCGVPTHWFGCGGGQE